MSEMQTEVGLNKRPMIVQQVHESGPYAWYASRHMSDGFQCSAPGATEREAIENLVALLAEMLERYVGALRDIAAMGPQMAESAAASEASEALGNHFHGGARDVVDEPPHEHLMTQGTNPGGPGLKGITLNGGRVSVTQLPEPPADNQ